MGTGYTRNDTANNIADGNIINAADLDGEFDAIEAAFATDGHTHDGTAAEGGAILVLGPSQEFVVSSTEAKPSGNAGLSLGTDLLQFNNLYIDGKAYIDGLGESMLVDTTSKIQFRDTALFINSSADGQLDLEADTTIELTAPTVSLTNDLKLKSDAAVLSFGADDEITVTHVHNTGLDLKAANGFTLNLQTGDTTIESGNLLGKISFNAPDEASGTDAILTAAAIEALAEDTFDSSTNSTALVFKTNTSGAAAERMRLTSDGNLKFLDNRKAVFGGGDDLQIYHDGTNSIIEDAGTGYLNIKTNGGYVIVSNNSAENLAYFQDGGEAALYWNGATGKGKKLATTSTGIDVTGTVTADGLTVDAATMRLDGDTGEAKFIIDSGTNYDAFIQYKEAGSNNWSVGVDGSDGNKFKFGVGTDLTTNTSLTIDPSSGALGIGNTSPAYPLHVQTSSGIVAHLVTTTHGSDAELNFTAENASGTAKSGQVFFDPDTNTIGFKNGSAKRLHVDSSGHIGHMVTPETSWPSGTAILQQGASSVLWSGTSSNYFYVASNTYWDGTNFKYINSAPASFFVQDANGNQVFKTAPSGTADANATFVEAMRITNDGRVKINDGAASALDFQVKGDSSSHLLFVDADTNNVLVGASSPVNGDGYLQVGSNISGSAFNNTTAVIANPTTMSSVSGSSYKILQLAQNTGNSSALTFRGVRQSTGSDWTSSRFEITMDVDNSQNLYRYLGFEVGQLVANPAQQTGMDFVIRSGNDAKMFWADAGDGFITVGNSFQYQSARLNVWSDQTSTWSENTLTTNGGLTLYNQRNDNVSGRTVGLAFRVTADNASTNALGEIALEQPSWSSFASRLHFKTRNSNGSYYEGLRIDSQSGVYINATNQSFTDFRVDTGSHDNFFFVDAGTNSVQVGTYQNKDGNMMTVGGSQSQTYSSSAAEGQLGVSLVNNTNGNNQHSGIFFRVSTNNGSNNANASIGLKQPTYNSHNGQIYFNLRSQSQNNFRQYMLIDSETGVIMNDGGETYMDFRVESDTYSHALFVDSNVDGVAVKGSASQYVGLRVNDNMQVGRDDSHNAGLTFQKAFTYDNAGGDAPTSGHKIKLTFGPVADFFMRVTIYGLNSYSATQGFAQSYEFVGYAGASGVMRTNRNDKVGGSAFTFGTPTFAPASGANNVISIPVSSTTTSYRFHVMVEMMSYNEPGTFSISYAA